MGLAKKMLYRITAKNGKIGFWCIPTLDKATRFMFERQDFNTTGSSGGFDGRSAIIYSS
jgi:hypothetical protein